MEAKFPSELSIRDVEDVCGPVEKWPGNCHAIAHAIVKAKLVDGIAVYGHWTGPVHPQSSFYSRSKAGFCRHGWVELADGRVLDPTRWVFENVKPYLYIGDPADFDYPPCEICGHLEDEHEQGFFRCCTVKGCDCPDFLAGPGWPYDEGGNQLRAATTTVVPPSEPPWFKLILSKPARIRLEDLLGHKLPGQGPAVLGEQEVFWIANLSYDALAPVTVDVYRALVKVNCEAFIPIDNRDRAEREGLK